MAILTQASEELFRRGPDECFATFDDLWQDCQESKARSVERWHPPTDLRVDPLGNRLRLTIGGGGSFPLNEWSFSQLCSLAGISKDTVNKLSGTTAGQVFAETMPGGSKPLQLLTTGAEACEMVRSIHGVSYTRLFDADLLSMVREFATDFQPPQAAGFAPGGQAVDDSGATNAAGNAEDAWPDETAPTTRPRGGTGLYRGEQDMFVFMIDPTGWTEINGEAFAPGFFLYNSEVGKRSLGIQTFWYQAICRNHLVYDAIEVVGFSRKHTANVHEAFSEIRRIVERLVERRDERRDGFVCVIRKAMETKFGDDADEVLKLLGQRGITRSLAKEALKIAERSGRFTIFSIVDALTKRSGRMTFAGERTEADVKASALLVLAA